MKFNRVDRGLYVPKAIREEIIQREGRCRICGSDLDLQVHHVNPYLPHDLVSEPGNLCVLCRQCHAAISFIQARFTTIYLELIAPMLQDPNFAFQQYVEDALRLAKLKKRVK